LYTTERHSLYGCNNIQQAGNERGRDFQGEELFVPFYWTETAYHQVDGAAQMFEVVDAKEHIKICGQLTILVCPFSQVRP
jgi:hypothetical protein